MVLIIDDDVDTRDTLATILSIRSIFVLVAPERSTALELLAKTEGISCVLLDYNMPGMTALEFVERAKKLRPHVGIVLVSAIDQVEERAKDLGLVCFQPKPISDFEKFYTLIDRCRKGQCKPV